LNPLLRIALENRFWLPDDCAVSNTPSTIFRHVYEVRPRKDKRGFDLISDVLPFGRLWYDKPDQAFRFNERKDNDAGRFGKALRRIVGKGRRYAKLIGGNGIHPGETWQSA
jgi:hypothetical protein